MQAAGSIPADSTIHAWPIGEVPVFQTGQVGSTPTAWSNRPRLALGGEHPPCKREGTVRLRHEAPSATSSIGRATGLHPGGWGFAPPLFSARPAAVLAPRHRPACPCGSMAEHLHGKQETPGSIPGVGTRSVGVAEPADAPRRERGDHHRVGSTPTSHNFSCVGGGIGRRTRLRIWRPQVVRVRLPPCAFIVSGASPPAPRGIVGARFHSLRCGERGRIGFADGIRPPLLGARWGCRPGLAASPPGVRCVLSLRFVRGGIGRRDRLTRMPIGMRVRLTPGATHQDAVAIAVIAAALKADDAIGMRFDSSRHPPREDDATWCRRPLETG